MAAHAVCCDSESKASADGQRGREMERTEGGRLDLHAHSARVRSGTDLNSLSLPPSLIPKPSPQGVGTSHGARHLEGAAM